MLSNLLEITEKEPFILFDANIERNKDLHKDPQLIYLITQANFFEQLDERKLESGIGEIEDFIEFVSKEGVKTIPEVAEELSDLLEILSRKAKVLNKSKEGKGRSNGKRISSHKGEELYKSLCWKVREGLRITKRSLYRLDREPLYHWFSNSLISLDEEIGIKGVSMDLNERGKKDFMRKRRKMVRPKKTDERLVAAAFYRSKNKKLPTAIITRDRRLIKLTSWLARTLASLDFYIGPSFRSNLEENPVRIYTPDYLNDNFKLRLDTSNMQLERNYILPYKGLEEEKALRIERSDKFKLKMVEELRAVEQTPN